MHKWDIWKVYLQTFWNNRICWKSAYFLRNLQTSRINNSATLRIKNAKFSGYIWTQTYSETLKSAWVECTFNSKPHEIFYSTFHRKKLKTTWIEFYLIEKIENKLNST